MDIYEEMVMMYLMRHPFVFINSQYSIDAEWSCPDFVVLNFKDKTVSIVEVSAAANVKALAERVANRNYHWIDKLKKQLTIGTHHIADSSWRFLVEVFIRKDAESGFRRLVGEPEDVKIHRIEELGFPWEWDWTTSN